MTTPHTHHLLHHTVEQSALRFPEKTALRWRDNQLVYGQLWREIDNVANALLHFGLRQSDRVAVYLPKQFESVISFFACSKAGMIFVPVNPILKRDQVTHILRDSGAKVLITSNTRLRSLEPGLAQCESLETIVISDTVSDMVTAPALAIVAWQDLPNSKIPASATIDCDPAAIFYTSGSTGMPKGVLLSHRNLVCGAKSVAEYLDNHCGDTILAVLPFSFDYGFSQLSSAFLVGAKVVLMDYLFPRDIISLLDKEKISGLAAVPSLWIPLSRLPFSDTIRANLRYITNSGGAMPTPCLRRLRQTLPDSKIYLMYGLTEAFRSTYLDPGLVDQFPTSIGKAIPNADILLLKEDGSECDIDEAGELVHRGSLVAMGYWNDPELTAQRFRPLASRVKGSPLPEIALWSGDTVKKDSRGLLYFLGRRDEMIKTSGYRVSPTEIEQVASNEFPRHEFAAFAIPHQELGQAIVLAMTGADNIRKQVSSRLRELLPTYMQPYHLIHLDQLPLNSNNKIDRNLLSQQFANLESDSKT